jgi:RND family efflux transporter MFP subunit
VRTAASAKATAAAQLGVAQALVVEAKSRVDVAGAAVALSKATYDKTFVRAPFDGVVVLKDAEVGEVVSPNVQGGSNARGSVVTMVDFSTLEVQAEVPETSLAAVAKGAQATIFLDAHPDQGYRGRVDRIWPTANRTKATVEVRVVFEAPDERLRPEMGVRVVFGSPERAPTDPAQRVIVIPEASLVTQEGRQGVLLLDVDTLRFAAVTLGERRSGKAIVTGGLEEGQELVLTPDPAWNSGMRARRAATAP